MRIVIAEPGTGKSYQKEIEKDKEALFLGKKVGDSISGDELGLGGYTLQLTGGSDTSGFPMRADIGGSRKLQALLSDGVGFHAQKKGERRRKTIRGNTYSTDTMQINAKVIQAGSQKLEEIFPPAPPKKE